MDSRKRLVAAATALSLLAALVGGCGDRRRDQQREATLRSSDAPWFTDVALQSGLIFTHFNGMAGEFYYPEIMPPGVALFDYDNDGDLDVFVVQGQMLGPKPIDRALFPPRGGALLRGRLFRNDLRVNADGTRTLSFTDVTDASRLDVRGYGMGVATGDFDNDGDEDLVITELTGQGVDLCVNNGSAVFDEQSARAGLRQATLPYTGFGAGWFDFDNDGRLDLLIVNGAVTQNVDAVARHEPFPLQQRKQLFRNVGGGRFEDVTARAGPLFALAEVSRGAAFGDVDNDGDTDVIVANASGPLRLLLNNLGQRSHWIGLRLVGQTAPRDMIGARVAIVKGDGSTLWRRARSDGSYASANDPRVLVGLGDSSQPPTVRVVWPDGRKETWTGVAVDRYTTLKQGGGT